MRWIKRIGPEPGDLKTVSKFLWFPTYCNGETKWLEYATVTYLRRQSDGFGFWSVYSFDIPLPGEQAPDRLAARKEVYDDD